MAAEGEQEFDRLRQLMARKDSPEDFIDDSRNIFVGDFSRPVLPHKYFVGSTIKIRISQTATPHRFHFQLDEALSDAQIMSTCYQEFYSDPLYSNLAMDQKTFQLNRPCIAPYKGLWHRAKIVNIDHLDRGRVKVFYVDYGTVEYVASDSLCFVHEYSSKQPLQAFRGCINNIRPAEYDWDFEACRVFNKAARQQTVHAVLRAIDIHNRIYYVHIDDLSQELVSKGKAYFSDQPIFCPYDGQLFDIPPTFDEVESGAFPTFKERNHARKEAQRHANARTDKTNLSLFEAFARDQWSKRSR